MRTFFLLLFISLNSFAQSKQALQKQLDSLKRIHAQVTINLSELQKKIDVAQSRLDLVTAKELSLGFQPIRLTLKGVVLFRDKNGTTKEYIPTGSVIDIIGYSEGNAKVLFKGKNGYISAVQFEEYAEVYKQLKPLIDKENTINAAKEAQENSETEDAEKKRIKNFISLGSPLAFFQTSISYNAIDVPVVNLSILNISDKVIDAYEVTIACYDNYGRPVNRIFSTSNKYKGISQGEIEIQKGEEVEWTLNGYENTTKIVISLVSVHFKNGKKWVPTKPVTIKSE